MRHCANSSSLMCSAAPTSAHKPIHGRGALLSPGAKRRKPRSECLALSSVFELLMPGTRYSRAAMTFSPESWLWPAK
eukprot:9497207-Pyramimonas_sp.AAC.1